MTRTPLALALRPLSLLAFVLVGACGTGGDNGAAGLGTTVGPTELALPVFDDGALKTVVLRNLSAQDVTVSLRRIPGGVATPVPIRAFAEVHTAPGVLEGWVLLDTRDPNTGLPGPGTGLVEAYLRAERSGPDEELCPAATLQTAEAVIPIHPQTDQVLLFNRDPVARTFTVCVFGTASGPPVNVRAVNVAGDGFARLDDFTLLPGRVGQLSVLQGTATFALAAQEDDDLVYTVDDRVGGTPRLLDGGPSSLGSLGFVFGRDFVSGGYEDFDLLVSNGTDDPSPNGFTIQSIHDDAGNAILTTPRTVTLGPRASRLFATTTAASLGLEPGEVHPFADLFGDVFAAGGLRRFTMNLSIGRGILLQGRSFDPLTFDFAGRVRPLARRTSTSVLVADAQTTLIGGIANVVTLSNPTAGPVTVQVRAFTQAEGTQYVLDPVTIPAFSMLDWRADALHLKETPGVPTLADVPFLRFLFSANAPFTAGGRRLRRDASNLQIFITPHLVRPD